MISVKIHRRVFLVPRMWEEKQDHFPSCLEAVYLFLAPSRREDMWGWSWSRSFSHGGLSCCLQRTGIIFYALDQVHWGVLAPLRQLHSCSRGALVTPAKAAHGDMLARASCCPEARHSSSEPTARPGLVWSQLLVRLPEETMQKGGRKEKFPLKNSSDSRRAARVRPIDYTLISVSFVPLLEGTLCGQRNPLSGLRAVVEQGLVQPSGTEAANSGLAEPNQKS